MSSPWVRPSPEREADVLSLPAALRDLRRPRECEAYLFFFRLCVEAMHVRCVGLWLLAMFTGACDGFALGPSLALSRSQSKLMAPRPLRSTLARFEMSHARQ